VKSEGGRERNFLTELNIRVCKEIVSSIFGLGVELERLKPKIRNLILNDTEFIFLQNL
jgi:hypothetical protein